MNKIFGLLLTATFLAPLSPAQAMDEEREFHSMARQLEAKVNSLVLDGIEGNEEKGRDALQILTQIEGAIFEGNELALRFFDQVDYFKGLLKDFGFEQQNNARQSSFSNSFSGALEEDLTQVQRDFELAKFLQDLDLERERKNASQVPPIIEGSPMHKIYSHLELHRDFQPVRDFFGSAVYIEAKKQKVGQEVHGIDASYNSLLAIVLPIADKIFPENGKLSLKETCESLKKFLRETPEILSSYAYEGKKVDLATMETMIDGVYQNDMDPALCSHAFNLARQLFFFGSEDGIYRLIDAVAENSLTEGGCLNGRRGRQLKEFCTMLMHNGLGE